MTTVTNRFHEITKQLQQATIWRQNERDPLVELDRWRRDAHIGIEQIYNKRRQQIEQLSEKHEREFLRQLARLRLSLNNIRQKLSSKKEISSHVRTHIETSIIKDLHKIENDINTRLGRAEIVIETIPVNLEDSVTVGIKTYLSSTTPLYLKEMLTKSQSQKPVRRSANEAQRAFDSWLQVKKNEEANAHKELHSARQDEQNTHKEQLIKQKNSQEAYDRWINRKKTEGAFTKRISNLNDSDINQETDET